MDDEVIVAAAVTICAISYYNYLCIKNKNQLKKRWRKRRWWMTQIHLGRTSATMDRQLSELVAEPSGEFQSLRECLKRILITY
ncbi:hypothetical protein evm_004838 [Chilo suppressalis]|nr:hypothetical protein evm_004838 [Chilo suppressalis]